MRRTLLLGVVVALLQGCVGPRLGAVAVNGQLATASQLQRVELVRAGAKLPLEPKMKFQVGDEIETGSSVTASIRWGSNTAILTPGTRVRIQNPSLWTILGEVFFSGAFKNETEYGIAAATGTKFAVKFRDGLTVRVLEGKVRVSPPGSTAGTDLVASQEVVFGRGLRVESRRKMSRSEIDRMLEWMRRAEPDVEPILPDLRGLEENEAKRLLSRLGIGVRVKPKPSTPAEVGRVVTQNPAPDRRAKSVELAVGAKSVATPNLVGLDRQAAQSKLTKSGLRRGKVRESITTGGSKIGKVTQQSPAAKERVLPNSSVDITVELPSTVVPNLAGKTPEQAAALLRKERLRLGSKTEGDAQNNRRSGVIYDQQPKAGTRVRLDESVNVTVTPRPVVY